MTPDLSTGSQSVGKIKPKPLPRTKSQPEALCGTDSITHPINNESNGVHAEMAKSNAYPAGYKTPRPVRPPPLPPKNKNGTYNCSTDLVNGSHSELTLKPVDVSGDRAPSPAPPPRPQRPQLPSNYYDRTLPGMERTPQGPSEVSPPARKASLCSMPQSPASPAPYDEVANLDRSYYGRTPGAGDSDRPACPPRPPRPGQPPKHTLLSSPSGHGTSPPQTQNSHRLSISSSSSSATQMYYDIPYEVYSSTPHSATANTTLVRPQQPPPPSFTPPATPSLYRPSFPYSVSYYNTEALYTEIEDPLYLEVLPQEDEVMFSSSDDVYRSGYQRYKTPKKPTATGCFPPTTHDTEDINSLLRWLKTVGYSGNMGPLLYGCRIEDETREFNQRAINVRKAMRLFSLLLITRKDTLREHISSLTDICDSLDKVQKKNKTMGIAGGTTGAVGGVAAVVGIALAPMTMGTSLIATAVGAGMVASAGGMGAHAAIANKKIVERKTVEKIVQDYKACVVDIEHCAAFIHSGMDELQRHDLARLQAAGAHPQALRMAQLSRSMFTNDMWKSAAPAGGMSSEGLLKAFAKDLDLYFAVKDGQKLKKSNEYKFSSRVRLLAENLQEVLDQLKHKWEMFCRF
ncbi:extensin-like isoform X2 [Myripristis murdjan]|uniref:extensin-like isoform X2 n=1 Tax=Myripristis murdjan TaxID=586833 RepID=UPI00117620E2|nr:extensin-like isoform X2 [Myripristis murdjan]